MQTTQTALKDLATKIQTIQDGGLKSGANGQVELGVSISILLSSSQSLLSSLNEALSHLLMLLFLCLTIVPSPPLRAGQEALMPCQRWPHSPQGWWRIKC